jgi:hypothetical protein
MAIGVIGVTSASDITGLQADGILGMAPIDQTGGSSALLMNELVSAGIIGINKFGVDYRDYRETDRTSKITLGGFDTSIVANESLFTWINLKETIYWSLDLTGITYNGTSVALNAKRGILDTGTSLTLFETADFNLVWGQITSGKTCGFSSRTGLRACICVSINDFKPIKMTFGSYETTMTLDSYIEFVDNGGTDDLCEFFIGDISVSLGAPFVLLGDSFLRNYYLYHDAVDMRVGFHYLGSAYSSGKAACILPLLAMVVNLI